MKHITNHYPEAQSISSLETTILKELKKQDMNPETCLWGTSICSDEVNNSINILEQHFTGPGPFHFGGISGIPFTGLTGFKAFASHIPENGGALIIYGPHIGISAHGVTGEIRREGQSTNSTCCGSLIAGLENVKTGHIHAITHNDYQQGQVNKLLIEHYNEFKNSDEQIKIVTDIAYDQIKHELTDIISSCIDDLASRPLLLIGGIIINTDINQEDYFDIRDISMFNK